MEKSFAPAAPKIRDPESNNEIATTQALFNASVHITENTGFLATSEQQNLEALFTPHAEAQEKPTSFFKTQIIDRLIALRNKYFPQLSEGKKTQLHAKSQENNFPRRELLKRFRQVGIAAVAASTIGAVADILYSSDAKADGPNYPNVNEIVGKFTYDGANAATYADANANTYDTGGEDGSVSISVKGDDCTNFVSNCLYVGKMPMTSDWHSYTTPYYRFNIFPDGYIDHATKPWTYTSSLYDYLVKNNLGTPLPPVTVDDADAFSGLRPGDVLFYDWGDGQGKSHAAILTFPGVPSDGTSSETMDLVDEHSHNRQGVRWTLEKYAVDDYGKKNLSNMTIFRVQINGNTPSY